MTREHHLDGSVEMDEFYIGGSPRYDADRPRLGRGRKGQPIHERTSAGLAAARAAARIGGRRKKLDATERREIAESVVSGRKTGCAY